MSCRVRPHYRMTPETQEKMILMVKTFGTRPFVFKECKHILSNKNDLGKWRQRNFIVLHSRPCHLHATVWRINPDIVYDMETVNSSKES